MASAKNSGAACRSRTAADVPYSMSSGCATTQSTRRKDSSGRAGKAMPAILPDLFPAGDGPAVCTARWAATLYGAPSLTTRASSLADAGTLPSCRNPNCEIAASTDLSGRRPVRITWPVQPRGPCRGRLARDPGHQRAGWRRSSCCEELASGGCPAGLRLRPRHRAFPRVAARRAWSSRRRRCGLAYGR